MKYVSIDIETTGLDPEHHHVVEFGAVLDDLTNPKPLDELPRFHCYVMRNEYTGSPYALAMHPEIFRRIATREEAYTYLEEELLMPALAKWLHKHGFDLNRGVPAAGKNFGSFDLQFLKRLPNWGERVKFSHRTLDPAILYWQPGDAKLPGLEECKQRAGLPNTVAHTALADALDVIRLLRYKLLGRIE